MRRWRSVVLERRDDEHDDDGERDAELPRPQQRAGPADRGVERARRGRRRGHAADSDALAGRRPHDRLPRRRLPAAARRPAGPRAGRGRGRPCPSTSGSSDEIIRTATPCDDELVEQAVDLGLGADVDTAGRLVDDQQRGRRGPATCRARPSAGCRPRGSQTGFASRPYFSCRRLAQSAASSRSADRADEPAPLRRPKGGERHVVVDAPGP